MTIEEKESYLLKANYTATDIMALKKCGRTCATKIMNDCKANYKGAILGRNVIKASSFWVREGTTIENELRLLAIAKGNARN